MNTIPPAVGVLLVFVLSCLGLWLIYIIYP